MFSARTSASPVRGAWDLFFGMTVGIGGVYIMRFWWWRVNAWGEIAAWISTAVVYVGLYVQNPDITFGWHLIVTAGVSTVCWVVVTLITPPTDEEKLIAFYERVRPGTPWWKPIAKRSKVTVTQMGWSDITGWVAGLIFIYTAMFGVGKVILAEWVVGLVNLAVASVAGVVVFRGSVLEMNDSVQN